MPTKSLMNRYRAKDISQIIKSITRARDTTQQAIDRFYKYKPDGKIKSLTNSATFKKQSGVSELEKQIKLLNKFIDKLWESFLEAERLEDEAARKKRMESMDKRLSKKKKRPWYEEEGEELPTIGFRGNKKLFIYPKKKK